MLTIRPRASGFASFPAALAALLAASGLSCAHGPERAPGAQGPSSVDTRDAAGRPSTLADLDARVIVVDICAAWSDACLVNARALEEACLEVCDEGAAFVTLLLDDPAPAALESYRAVMGTSRPVLAPGPRTLAGESALGEVGEAIPRLVIFGPDGAIAADEAGGILSAHGLVNRVRELL